jgi:hypothetical protein
VATKSCYFANCQTGRGGTALADDRRSCVCALTVGKPVVGIAALQELRVLPDAVGARASDPAGASMSSKKAAMRRKSPSIPTQIPLFPPAGYEIRIELGAYSSGT